MYTWKVIASILLTISILLVSTEQSKAPFIAINTVHQAYSQFQVNLILNQNRNHPIIITTVSNNDAQSAAKSILLEALQSEPFSGFAVLIDCREFVYNLNKTLGICYAYNKDAPVDETNDPNFSCQLFAPAQTRIKEKGHILMKNHIEENLESGKYFKSQYLSDMLKKNIPDFVKYIEDQYDLNQFLFGQAQFRYSKRPKLLYFDENLLAPLFLRKVASLLDGKIAVGVTDQIQIIKKYSSQYDSLVLLEYDFEQKHYISRNIELSSDRPIHSILQDEDIKKCKQVKKYRDILLDFQHGNYTIYNFSHIKEVWNLQTHSRVIILDVSIGGQNNCKKLDKIAPKYQTLFNYVCFSQKNQDQLKVDITKFNENFLMINEDLSTAQWISKSNKQLYEYLPKNISRQRVSTETEANHCIRTASISKRDPLFFYLNEKSRHQQIAIMNYLNSLPEVTSLLYFCQIYLPDQATSKKFSLRQNTLFILSDPQSSGHMKKTQHSKIQNFIQIKMFLREVSIQRMIQAYEKRLINNNLQEIKTSQELSQYCFSKNCIIGLIATGKYRQDAEIKMFKQLKMQYQQLYQFVWIDGICHWDVPKQFKILKKKQKVIDKSYVLFYNQKEISFALWDAGKFWDRKEFNRWIKSLRGSKAIKHLKFGIDIEDRECKKKKPTKKKSSQEL